jgi:3-hydroxyisobutyrate dehydrogenase-like beta-hydroxyacid dehydrogenase
VIRERVAVLGTGRMGAAMVAALRRAGLDVTVWNRTSSKAEEVAGVTGAQMAGTPAKAVAEADVVVSSLADDEAVRRRMRATGEPPPDCGPEPSCAR